MDRLSGILSKILIYFFLTALFVITLFPIIYTLLSSFKSNLEILAADGKIFPNSFSMENYKTAWSMGHFAVYTWNSIYMTLLIVAGSILTSTMGGYVFARGRFPGRKYIFAIFTATMFVSFGSITLYPILQVARFLNIHRSLFGVVIVTVFGLNMTNLYLVRVYINSLSAEIDEAAKIDGCSFFRIFWNVIFPLLKPVVATVGLLTFREAWNDYLMPLIFTVSNPSQQPLVVGIVSLKSSGRVASSWNLMLAGSMFSILPMIGVYLFFNRYFISGLVSGAVKG